jgi:surfactin synthase thioesterase subunit
MWLKPILQVDAPEKHLLFFPWAGAGIEGVFQWRKLMPPRAAFSGVQLPGRGSRFGEKPARSLETIIEQIVSAIAAQKQKPTVLYGHSFGALLAYEVCARLEQQSVTPIERLVVSGASAPSHLSQEQRIAHLPEEEFFAEIKALNGIPPQLLAIPEMIKLFLPVLRADFEVYERYTFDAAREPIRSPIVVCTGREDPCTSEEGIARWRQMTSGPCDIHFFDGGHFFIEAHAQHILRLALA